MTNSEINRTILKIRNAREFSKKILENPNSTEEERENAIEIDEAMEALVSNMCSYTNAVFDDNFKNARRTHMREEYNSGDEYRKACERIEFNRKAEHDSLIVSIKMADLICRENGLAEIYGKLPKEYQQDTSGLMGKENRDKPGVVETRHNIADWTWNFVLGTTVGMVIDVAELDFEHSMEDMDTVSKIYRQIGGEKGAKKIVDELTK